MDPNRRKKGRYVDNDKLKVGLFKKVLTVLENSQYPGSSFAKGIKELKALYYRQTDPDEVKEYRKYFFTLLWQAMIVPFKDGTCPAQERMIKCYTKFVLNTGTEDDTSRPREDFPPFYTFCIRAYKDYHNDSRTLVRLRLIQLVHEIVMEKSGDPFFARSRIKNSLKAILLERTKDVNPSTRAFAFKCLNFLVDGTEKEILERLKYHSEFDPSLGARKSAFVTLVSGRFPVKPSMIVKKAYDKSEAVRLEAFKALIRVPFGNIKANQRLKLIQWGLMQPSANIKNVLVDELIPAWIADETYGNDVIKFFTHIDIARNSQTAHLLFRALLPNDSEETFQKLDLGFLNEDKLIPLEGMVVEKMLYWRYICSLFKSKPYCTSKIIPDPSKVIDCIERIISEVHEENRKANEEDRDEEFEYILCLEQILRIAELCDYEEASRRAMEILLRKILRDPVLDEAVVIFTAVDLAHAIVDKSQFNNFMIEILQEVFEVESETVLSANQSRLRATILQNSPILSSDPALSQVLADRCSGTAGRSENDKTKEANSSKIIDLPDVMDAQSGCENNENELGALEADIIPDSFGGTFAQPANVTPTSVIRSQSQSRSNNGTSLQDDQCRKSLFTSTPVRLEFNGGGWKALNTPKNKQHEILKLKTERGEIIAQRHRLRNKMDLALQSNDFLEANRCKQEINAIQDRENAILKEIGQLERPDSPRTPEVVRNGDGVLTPVHVTPPSASTINHERSMLRQSRNNQSLFLNFSEDSIDFNENEFEAKQVAPNLSDSLRGIVMLTRFLAWQDRINPYVKMMYDDNIFDCLEKEDYRIRMYTMYLICMVGLIDKTEAKKSLAVLIQAVSQEEDELVVVAAFKCMVDLLLQHDYPVFLTQDEDEDFARDLPYPLNDSNAGVPELQNELMKHLKSFPALTLNPAELKGSTLSVKVLGMIKLLLRDRIDDEDTISWLFNLWLDERYIATPVCFNIGHWLPLYASISHTHAFRIASAFLSCVKKIFNNEGSVNDEDLTEKATKLVNFVFPHFGNHQEALDDSCMVTERVVVMILAEINRDAFSPCAVPLLTFAKLLDIQTKAGATEIFSNMKKLVSSLSSVPSPRPMRLISLLKAFGRRLERRFGPLIKDSSSDTDGDESGAMDTEESGSEQCDPNVCDNSPKSDNRHAGNAIRATTLCQSDNHLQPMIFDNGSELIGNNLEFHSLNQGLFGNDSERRKRMSTLRPKGNRLSQ